MSEHDSISSDESPRSTVQPTNRDASLDEAVSSENAPENEASVLVSDSFDGTAATGEIARPSG